MSNTQERVKQRREYLKQKGAAYSMMWLAALLTIPCALIAFLFLAGPLYSLYKPSLYGGGTWSGFVVFIGCSPFFVLFGLAFLACAISARQAHQKAKQLPYVPPVTTDNLPAEEVLVRGSEEPTQEQSQLLLRGTDSSADTGEQELLRGSQGQE